MYSDTILLLYMRVYARSRYTLKSVHEEEEHELFTV